MNLKIATRRVSLLLLLCTLCAVTALAQTSVFTYQGRLTDGGTAANGNYDLQFALFDSVSGGTQIGATQTVPTVVVSAGIFSVQLDFGASAFPGAPRFLEISARTGAASFTTLSPRQQITSTPYAIRSLNASSADAVTVSGVPGGSGNYIQNATTPQASANFNISGNGIIGGNVGIGVPNPQAKLDVNGTVQIASGGSGGQVVFAAPNGESGMLISGTSRADIRFDGSTLKLLAGVSTGAPISTNGIAIATSGNVGIGTTNPTDKLTVQTATSNYGFIHTDGTVTVGSFVGGSTGGGWYGTRSNHPLSFFTNNQGASLTIGTSGNISQPLVANGLVKAMLLVNADGTINLCYNSQLTGSAATTPPCGFSVRRNGSIGYIITFPFQIDRRFFSVTVGDPVATNGQVSALNQTEVGVFISGGGASGGRFYFMVF